MTFTQMNTSPSRLSYHKHTHRNNNLPPHPHETGRISIVTSTHSFRMQATTPPSLNSSSSSTSPPPTSPTQQKNAYMLPYHHLVDRIDDVVHFVACYESIIIHVVQPESPCENAHENETQLKTRTKRKHFLAATNTHSVVSRPDCRVM